MMFIMAALQLNLKSRYDTLKNFLCGLDKGPIIKRIRPQGLILFEPVKIFLEIGLLWYFSMWLKIL